MTRADINVAVLQMNKAVRDLLNIGRLYEAMLICVYMIFLFFAKGKCAVKDNVNDINLCNL